MSSEVAANHSGTIKTARKVASRGNRKKTPREISLRHEVPPEPGKTCVLLRDVLLFDGNLPAGMRFRIGQSFRDGHEVPRYELKWLNGKVAVSGIAADRVKVDE